MTEEKTSEKDAALADEFAKAALTGILASGEFNMAGVTTQELHTITQRSYQLAALMMRKHYEVRG